jgi:tetratricopeptide (TPR) repeat protein
MSTARVEVQEVRTGAFPISVDPKRSKLTGTLLQKRLPGIEELTKYGNADFRGNPVAYAGAWFLVHSLILGTPQHRQAFDCYLRGLSSLAQKEPEVFAQCFPGRLPSELEAAYMARALASELPTQLAPLKVSIDKEYQARAMAPAEVEVLWGSLLPGTAAYDEGRLEHAQKAIDSDPTRPEGYIFRATLHMQASDVKAAKADLREALSVAPSDPQVLTALVNVLLRSGDLSEELDAAASKLAFEAKTASAYLSLAWYELARERPGKATVFGKEAVAGDAGCVGCLVVTALASYRAGQIDGAVSYQRMAVSLAGERATDRMQRTLDKYLKSQALGPAAGGS